MTAPTIDLVIQRGKTFQYAFLYADDALEYRPITALPSLAPVRLTVPGHGVPDGWPVMVAGVRSPVELNTEEGEYRFARVVDADTIEFNAMLGTGWKPLAGGGQVVFNQPAGLAGWSARATVRDRVGGAELLRWRTTPDVGDESITIDVAGSAFVLNLSAEATADLAWTKGVWEMEAIDPDGKVYPVVAISKVVVSAEVVI